MNHQVLKLYFFLFQFTVEEFVNNTLDESHKWFKNPSIVHGIQPQIAAFRDFAKANPKVCFLINLLTYNSDDTPAITELSVQGQITPFKIPEAIQLLETVSKGSNTHKLRATFFNVLSPRSDLKAQIEVKISKKEITRTPVSQACCMKSFLLLN